MSFFLIRKCLNKTHYTLLSEVRKKGCGIIIQHKEKALADTHRTAKAILPHRTLLRNLFTRTHCNAWQPTGGVESASLLFADVSAQSLRFTAGMQKLAEHAVGYRNGFYDVPLTLAVSVPHCVTRLTHRDYAGTARIQYFFHWQVPPKIWIRHKA